MIGTCWDITDTKQREQLAHLGSEVGDALTALKPMRERLQLCAEALVHQLDAALARIWIVNEAEDLLEMQASAGIHTQTDGTRSRIPLGKYKIGRIAQEARLRFSNNVGAEPDVDDKEWVKQNGLVSFVGHPLVVEGRVVGVMAFFSRTKLNPDTVHALAGIAKTIAVAIDRDRAERELEQARDAADAANQAKSAFLATMSHELRTPMNAILGYSEILMEDAKDKGQEDFIPDLQKIHASGNHLLSLINNILDLSKIEAGKMDLFLESFGVRVIEDVVSTLKPLAPWEPWGPAGSWLGDLGLGHDAVATEGPRKSSRRDQPRWALRSRNSVIPAIRLPDHVRPDGLIEHGRGADLHGAAAEQEVVEGVVERRTRRRCPRTRVGERLGHLGHLRQRERQDGRPAQAAATRRSRRRSSRTRASAGSTAAATGRC